MFDFRPYVSGMDADDMSVLNNDNFRRTIDTIKKNYDRIVTLENPIYYNGDIGTELTATTYKTLGGSRQIISGITKTNTTTLTVNTKGIYFIHIQQLIQAGANAGYFTIRINNADATYGYYTASSMNDVPATILRELNVNDTIRVYQSHAITSCWAIAHSDMTVFCIKRT